MDIHALIPLIAAIAYIPLFVILLINRHWQRQQKFFLLFLIPTTLWSLSDFLVRSNLLIMLGEFLAVGLVLCIGIWMGIGLHYFLRSFYQFKNDKAPFAYVILLVTIVLVILGYIPRGVDIIAGGAYIVEYGNWFILMSLLAFALIAKDIYFLVGRCRFSPNPLERNQIAYLFVSLSILVVFGFITFTPVGKEFPVSHIGSLAMACILTYAVVRYRLLDVRVVLHHALMYLGVYGGAIASAVLLVFFAHIAFGFNIDFVTLGVAFAIGIAIVVIFVHWLKPIWQRKVEQTFIGERYDYRRNLFGFANKISSIPSLEESGSQLVSLLSQSIDCRRACLLLPSGEDGDFSAQFLYPPVENNPMAELKLRRDSPVVVWLEREAQVLPERNLGILTEFQGMWQEEKEAIQAAEIEMFAPLVNKDKLVAIIAAGNKQDNKLYTVEDIDLMESAASRVAAAMEKEYLHERLGEQEAELAIINRLAAIITSSVNIQDIFEGFVQELRKVVDVDYATIGLVEEGMIHFLALSSQIESMRLVGQMIPLKGTTTEWITEHKKALYEANLAQYKRFPSAEYYISEGIRSIVHLPLIIKDRCIGSLIIASRRPDAYSAKQVNLLEHLALQIAMPVENSQIYAKAEQRSRIDELTGLFNRRHFEERIKEEIARHSRYGGTFSLLMLDLDSFKTYNDIYGHPNGDQLLNQVGGITQSSIRNADEAFRYGGDEFTIILPLTTVDDAYTVAERVRENIDAEMKAKEVAVTCSIGLASYPSDGVMSGELVTAVDTALYYAKRTGGNRVYLSSRILSEPVTGAGAYTRSSGLSAVYALAAAVEARDSYTYGHSRKVSTYAVALAEAIGLHPNEVSRISTAALLHDIGKIGIPDKVLSKKGKFTAAEWEVMKAHPQLGANIVGNVPRLVPCLPAILYHHEHYDGTGYPEGLKGDNIPLEARILIIADAFDAMISPRPYRDASSREKAVEELRRSAGTQFDPDLVEVFIGIIQAGLPEKVKASENPPGENTNL